MVLMLKNWTAGQREKKTMEGLVNDYGEKGSELQMVLARKRRHRILGSEESEQFLAGD